MLAKVSWIVVIFCIYYTSAQQITPACLECICLVTSECDINVGCNGPVCGPFYITKQYWTDADKPALSDKPADEDEDQTYRNCANNVYCAARVLQNYMSKFAKDCTGNGVIDCEDYVRLHRFGASGCAVNSLHNVYEGIFKRCINSFGTSA
ncbi:PREDICTED: lysozyme-like [Vollenhovia emeryi]|uniref:lysozyme-like n=1 Tax=Vollenhovia emeryi TaxID=411798 RepID=UPI0005F4D245|nr:PREDICTED: lysozyme-like [Vollenhovia emeryi]XP_011868865.1 PREDICTED: lysozyme-like [Vollenhovia emeryi]XP_011868866.1 PREDICTED: lysozyme-like [Vollenhovia emeryi]